MASTHLRSRSVTRSLVLASRALCRAVDAVEFRGEVRVVYNPLVYARKTHEMYLALARPNVHALFLGMNPGPFGMAQTGVPFGEVAAVREFLRIDGVVKQPKIAHAKRPVEGFACSRSEVSGRRFWGLMQEEFPDANTFFRRAFVWNWCPLAFVSASGANITPDKLLAGERAALESICDRSLARIVKALQPKVIVGVGGFATLAARRALGESIDVRTVLHPSPASPAANRGWSAVARKQLVGIL